MKTFVYILRSTKNKILYTGITKNLIKRIEQHNSGLNVSTKAYIPYKLLWYCVFPNLILAARFEKYLKSASGKAFINKRLIE